jgi:galactokinase
MRDSPDTTLATRVREAFRRRFGGDDARLFFAPGRVNLIGAHLDYNGGDVLPLAVDRGIYVAARLTGDGRVRLISLDQEPAVEVRVADIGARQDPAHAWASYPLGVLHFFWAETGRARGLEMVFGGDLPMASGLSSSAAIEVATATALDALHGTDLAKPALAMLGHRAETEYVGLKCGIMDQFASALGKAGHALLLHCHTRAFEHVPLDARAFEVLVLDTRKPRTLATTGFNERVRECAEAHRRLRAAGIDAPCLAAYTAADLARVSAALGPVLERRARHVVTEMRRVAEVVEALRAGDIARVGRCLDASHRSTAEDYEVSCAELDAITAAARACPGVHGARLTGAGFGGCAIALVQPGAAAAVSDAVAVSYEARFGVAPRFEVLRAGPGPREVAA